MARKFYQFGKFRLDPSGRVLYREKELVPLTPKCVEILLWLVENYGEVVDKDELMRHVWPDTYVEEINLTRNVSVLRKTLGGDVEGREFIETIPKRGYRFVAPVEEAVERQSPASSARIMLAVLPFENLNRDEKQEYFSDGLTEEMITQLGRLNPEKLGVIARTSAMKYKRTKKSIEEIGSELGVCYVLEGSVRREGRRVRITAQLIQVSDQTHLWAESYERDLGGILVLQRDVSEAIAREIEIKLAPQEQVRLANATQIKPEAYEAYLKGRYLWNQRSREALEKSVRYFQKAIQIAPRYAAAYAGLADTYLTLQDQGYLAPREATGKARAVAAKALRIDESLAEAHSSLGHAHLHEFNWPAAEQAFKRALALNPSYPAAHFYYANYLLAAGQAEEAIAEARRAQVLDPVSLPAESNTAIILYHAGLHEQAMEQIRKTFETDANCARAHENLGRVYEVQGKYQEAIAEFQKVVKLSGRDPGPMASLAHAYGRAGRKREALRLLKELKQRATKEYVSPYAVALVYIGLGNNGQSLVWLEKAYQDHSSGMPFLRVNPRLAALESDAGFQRLVQRMNFPTQKKTAVAQ